jgi:methylmalonyl-CoA/ethylmalonyl-CoA epimerase
MKMSDAVKAAPDSEPKTVTRPASLHHVGFAVMSIEATASSFARSLGAQWNGAIIHDPLQEARVTFLYCGAAQNPAVELVEPAGEKSPLHKFVARGGRLHHVCYEVDSLDEQLRESRTAGGLVARQPLPAAAFAGRRIAWVYTREKLLVEYLER